MNISILGGYGYAGRAIARYLAPQTRASITLLGRNEEKARSTAEQISRETNRTIRGARTDASDKSALMATIESADLVVVAASCLTHTQNVVEAAIETQTDYFDIQLSSPDKWSVLRNMEQAIQNRRLCFITDGGYHPGVPAAMVRLAADQVSNIEKANVASIFSIDWKNYDFSTSTIDEFTREFRSYKPIVLLDRQWVQRGTLTRKFDFGAPFGTKSCVPFIMEEMRYLPDEIPTLRETGFFISGFGPIVDYAILPVTLGWLRVAPRRTHGAARFFRWGLDRFASSKRGVVLLLEAASEDQTFRLRISHADPYVLTAVPAVACLLQYLGGRKKPGLWLQAHFVDPSRFFEDIASMGVSVDARLTAKTAPAAAA